jgi:hypothetical protein
LLIFLKIRKIIVLQGDNLFREPGFGRCPGLSLPQGLAHCGQAGLRAIRGPEWPGAGPAVSVGPFAQQSYNLLVIQNYLLDAPIAADINSIVTFPGQH